MLLEEKIQRELIRLANKWNEGYEIQLLKEFIDWTNLNLISPYRIVYKPENYGYEHMWQLEKRLKNHSSNPTSKTSSD